jgi:hypothetical protein
VAATRGAPPVCPKIRAARTPWKLRLKPGDYQAKYRFLFGLRASTLLTYTSRPERPKGVTTGE